jgi:hypothetical protein
MLCYRGKSTSKSKSKYRGEKTVTKINEMSADIFTKAVKEALNAPNEKETHGLINKALQSKVPVEDINTIITDVYNQAGQFTLARGVNKVRSAIENKIRAATATTIDGILIGSRDLVGKQIPNKYTLIRLDKKHMEVSSFDGQVPFQGGKIDIPVPAAVILKAEYDENYDSWSLVSLETYKPLSKEELVKHLSKVVIPISAINADYAYHKTDEKTVSSRPVVIQGNIARVSAEAVFRFEEDGEGNRTSTLDHYLPVYCGREMKQDEKMPCMQFLLNSKTRGVNSVRCHLSQQRKGTPTILVDDFVVACEEAAKKFKDPEAQASNANEWLRDISVIVVGSVNRYTRSTGQDKSAQNWVDIGVTGIIEVEDAIFDGTGAQKKLDQEAPKPIAIPSTHTTDSQPIAGPITSSPAPATEKKKGGKRSAVQKNPEVPENPAPSPEVVKAAADKVFPPATPSPAATPASAAQPAASAAPSSSTGTLPPKLLAMARVVKAYCNILDTTPANLSKEEVKSKMLDVITVDGIVMPDAVIEQILNYLRAGGIV